MIYYSNSRGWRENVVLAAFPLTRYDVVMSHVYLVLISGVTTNLASLSVLKYFNILIF